MIQNQKDASDDMKRRFVEACKKGVPISVICRDLQLSRSTAYSWRASWLSGGDHWYARSKRARYAFDATSNLVWRPRLIEAMALQEPGWGCDRIAEKLRDFSIEITSPTVQSILLELGLGSEMKRRGRLESIVRNAGGLDKIALTDSQHAYLLAQRYKDEGAKRPVAGPGTHPGEILIHDSCRTGPRFGEPSFAGNIIIDTFDNRIFCRLSGDAEYGDTKDAIEEVVRIFARKGLKVAQVFTGNSRIFGLGRANHPYSIYLNSANILHQGLGPRGINLKRPAVILKAWQTIVCEFLAPRKEQITAESMPLHEVDFQLSEWLKARHTQQCGIHKIVDVLP